MSAKNDFCFVDLATEDLGKAKKVYGSLFAWTFEEMNMGEQGPYVSIKAGGGPGAGMYVKPTPGAPTAWTPYVQVDNLEATVEKVKELGGGVVIPPTQIPHDMGAFSIIRDPSGGVIGVYKP